MRRSRSTPGSTRSMVSGTCVMFIGSLDGVRYLGDAHRADDKLIRLVAHHSCAVYGSR
ncbi:hypothetical protein GCM10010517_59290 [Streptosporangium fragile]|uniref:Uncharacterized protein n=1 Tax=Streptosporangium fragile TaxID=46186 RepID=A0ABP6IL64_9ACTN